jgi:hypothetical protein
MRIADRAYSAQVYAKHMANYRDDSYIIEAGEDKPSPLH